MKCMKAAQKLPLLPQVEGGVQVLLLSTPGLAKPEGWVWGCQGMGWRDTLGWLGMKEWRTCFLQMSPV